MRTAIASSLRLDNAMIGDHAVRVFFSSSKAPVSSGPLGKFSLPSDPHQHEESLFFARSVRRVADGRLPGYKGLMSRRHVYGPVPSRRLGLSLGVDLIPHKICCYDCTYCQVGPTTERSVERREFVDPDEVIREVEDALRERPGTESVTLAGSGEPTLYRELPALIAGLRRVTKLPLALLTNGGLFWQEEALRAGLELDLVAPSLDAADPIVFEAVNRPHPEVTFERMVSGLAEFYRRFKGTSRLEVLLVRGVNDSPESLSALARLAASLSPTQVDLNTVVRPPAHGAVGLSASELEGALAYFAGCRASVVASFRGPESTIAEASASRRSRILETLARRPCTAQDLSHSLGLDVGEVQTICEHAVHAGELAEETSSGARYYRAATARIRSPA